MTPPLSENPPIIDHRIKFDSDRITLKQMLELKKKKYIQIFALRKQATVNRKGKLQTGLALIIQNLN